MPLKESPSRERLPSRLSCKILIWALCSSLMVVSFLKLFSRLWVRSWVEPWAINYRAMSWLRCLKSARALRYCLSSSSLLWMCSRISSMPSLALSRECSALSCLSWDWSETSLWAYSVTFCWSFLKFSSEYNPESFERDRGFREGFSLPLESYELWWGCAEWDLWGWRGLVESEPICLIL